jgi:hypothetical protein
MKRQIDAHDAEHQADQTENQTHDSDHSVSRLGWTPTPYKSQFHAILSLASHSSTIRTISSSDHSVSMTPASHRHALNQPRDPIGVFLLLTSIRMLYQ